MSFPDDGLLARLSAALDPGVVPVDVVAVLGFVALAVPVVLGGGVPVAVRAAAALPLVFFLPGYALVTALFPERASDAAGGRVRPGGRRRRPDTDAGGPPTAGGPVLSPPRHGITGRERVVIAVGTSLALVPVVGVVLSATGAGFEPVTETLALATVVAGGTLVGWGRRRALPERRRFRPRLGLPAVDVGDADRLDLAVAVVVAVSVAVAGLVVGYAVVVAPPSTDGTGLALLSPTPNGTLVADDYPRTLTAGERAGVVVAVANRADGPRRYTVAVDLQRVRTNDTEVTVVDSRRLQRYTTTVPAGQRVTRPVRVPPTVSGEDRRLFVGLYRGSVPAVGTAEAADRHVHLRVDVRPPGGTAAVDATRGPARPTVRDPVTGGP